MAGNSGGVIEMLLTDYFFKEIETYKKGQVCERTYDKYQANYRFVAENFPNLISPQPPCC